MNDEKSFKVGDLVSWGWNGDYNPGVVVRVTPATVEVADVELVLGPLAQHGYADAPGCVFVEGQKGVSFESYEGQATARKIIFKRKKDGTFRDGSMKHGHVLSKGSPLRT